MCEAFEHRARSYIWLRFCHQTRFEFWKYHHILIVNRPLPLLLCPQRFVHLSRRWMEVGQPYSYLGLSLKLNLNSYRVKVPHGRFLPPNFDVVSLHSRPFFPHKKEIFLSHLKSVFISLLDKVIMWQSFNRTYRSSSKTSKVIILSSQAFCLMLLSLFVVGPTDLHR